MGRDVRLSQPAGKPQNDFACSGGYCWKILKRNWQKTAANFAHEAYVRNACIKKQTIAEPAC
jgi:hypothetical protein